MFGLEGGADCGEGLLECDGEYAVLFRQGQDSVWPQVRTGPVSI